MAGIAPAVAEATTASQAEATTLVDRKKANNNNNSSSSKKKKPEQAWDAINALLALRTKDSDDDGEGGGGEGGAVETTQIRSSPRKNAGQKAASGESGSVAERPRKRSRVRMKQGASKHKAPVRARSRGSNTDTSSVRKSSSSSKKKGKSTPTGTPVSPAASVPTATTIARQVTAGSAGAPGCMVLDCAEHAFFGPAAHTAGSASQPIHCEFHCGDTDVASYGLFCWVDACGAVARVGPRMKGRVRCVAHSLVGDVWWMGPKMLLPVAPGDALEAAATGLAEPDGGGDAGHDSNVGGFIWSLRHDRQMSATQAEAARVRALSAVAAPKKRKRRASTASPWRSPEPAPTPPQRAVATVAAKTNMTPGARAAARARAALEATAVAMSSEAGANVVATDVSGPEREAAKAAAAAAVAAAASVQRTVTAAKPPMVPRTTISKSRSVDGLPASKDGAAVSRKADAAEEGLKVVEAAPDAGRASSQPAPGPTPSPKAGKAKGKSRETASTKSKLSEEDLFASDSGLEDEASGRGGRRGAGGVGDGHPNRVHDDDDDGLDDNDEDDDEDDGDPYGLGDASGPHTPPSRRLGTTIDPSPGTRRSSRSTKGKAPVAYSPTKSPRTPRTPRQSRASPRTPKTRGRSVDVGSPYTDASTSPWAGSSRARSATRPKKSRSSGETFRVPELGVGTPAPTLQAVSHVIPVPKAPPSGALDVDLELPDLLSAVTAIRTDSSDLAKRIALKYAVGTSGEADDILIRADGDSDSDEWDHLPRPPSKFPDDNEKRGEAKTVIRGRGKRSKNSSGSRKRAKRTPGTGDGEAEGADKGGAA